MTAENIGENLLLYAVYCLEKNKDAEAAQVFTNIIKMESGFESVEKVNDWIKSLASKKQPSSLTIIAQKALLGLGLIYARRGDKEEAEENILSAAYACQDGGLLFLTGTFYLMLADAEVDTAFAYFDLACKINPQWVWRCDESVQWFWENRMVFYPRSLIMPYTELWDKMKQEITKPLKNKMTMKDSFVDRFLVLLKDFGEKETKRLKMKEKKCPKCGSSSLGCRHREVGTIDYYDEYTLYCLDCDYIIETVKKYGGSPLGVNWSTYCPYCGQKFC